MLGKPEPRQTGPQLKSTLDGPNSWVFMDKRDPIENDPRFKGILAQADAAAEQELKDEPHGLGFCHVFWATKKRILKEQHGVEWKSPAEMRTRTWISISSEG